MVPPSMTARPAGGTGSDPASRPALHSPTMSSESSAPARRSAVVTGGGTGIGRAVARAFAERGHAVLVVGRTEDTLNETARGYHTISPLVADITEAGAAERIVATALDRHSRIDVLVNNAATALPLALADTSGETVRLQFATNVIAPVDLTRCAVEALAATRGTVVNVGTAGALGLRAWPNNGVYGATKVALDFLTRTWAVELAPRGVRVVGVAPGVADTGIGVRNGQSEEEYAGFLKLMGDRAPAGRVGSAEEIATWIARLTEPEAAYLTGVVIPIDGGLSLT
jgi:C-7 ketoreductase